MRLATGLDDTINTRRPPITGGRLVSRPPVVAPPSLGYDPTGIRYGPLAQPAEHRTFNPGVVGSIPTRPTLFGIARRWALASRSGAHSPVDLSKAEVTKGASIGS